MGVFDISQTLFGTGGTKPPVSTSTTYGTAVSDSSDGTVNVVMDGYSVTQPSGIEETVEILADEFIDGQAELPHPAFAGTVSIVGSDGVELLEDEFEVDGNILTIDALQGSRPVDVHYTASLELAYSSDDFESDSAELQFAPTGSITVTLDGVDVPCSYSDGQLIIEGASIQRDAAFVVEYDVPVSVTAEFDDGTCILSDEPEAITLVGIDSQGNETEISGYELDGAIVTLTDQTEYAQYVISYTLHVTTEFNYSDTLPEQEIPEATIEDGSEEEEQEEQGGIVQLDGQPDSVSVTMDGEPFADYTLDEGTLTLNWVPEEPVTYLVSYDAVIELELTTSDFSNGAYQLTAVPNGSVSTTVDDVQVANTVDGYMLSIPSLVSDVASYTVTYQAQISDGVVELPTSPSVRSGETVQVSIVSGTPVVTAVVGEGDRQDFNIDVAYTTAASAEGLAEEAKAVAEAVGQHFWHRSDDPDGDGAGTGAFVTDVEQEDFLEHINDTTETRPLHNLLMNAEGILLRAAKKIRAAFTPSGVAFYDGAGNDSSNIVSSFTNSSVNLGRSNEKHLSITPSTIYMYDADGTVHSSIGTNFTIGRTSSYNTLLTSSAVYIRNAAKYLLRAAGSTVYFYDGSGNNTANIAAQIGSAGATIGKTASAHVDIDSDSIDFYDGTHGILSMVNDANYSGFTWTPTTLAGGDSGGRILSAKNEPYMWIQPYTGLSIGGTQPSRGAVRISDNGVTIVPSLTLNNALAIANGGTGATTASGARSNLNVVGASDQSKQNARFITLTGATQVYGLWATCINANNTSYNGKEVGVVFGNNSIGLWNSTANSTIWVLSGLSGDVNLGVTTPTFTANTTNWTASETYVKRSGRVVSVSLAGQAKAGVGTWQTNTYHIGTLSAHPSATKLFTAVAQLSSAFTAFIGKIDTNGKIYLRTAGTAIPANSYVWLDCTFICS